MNRAPRLLILGVVAGVSALTITPATHDFGKLAVGTGARSTSQVRLPPFTAPTDSIFAALGGRDPGDFWIDGRSQPGPPITYNSTCMNQAQTGSCTMEIHFKPLSIGHKTATLTVNDNRGNRA